MKNFLAAAALASAVVLASTSAFANSCSQQGQVCKGWAAQQGGQAVSYARACQAEVGKCIARCKKGQMVFIGVSTGPGGGQQYPISACN